MKRILSLVVVLIMIFCICAACTAEQEGSVVESSSPPDTVSETPADVSDTPETPTEYKGPVTEFYGKTCSELLAAGEKPLIGSCFPVLADEFLVWISTSLNTRFEEAGFSTMAVSAENNIETQISQVENFVAMGAVAIIEAAMDIETLSTCNTAAVEAGVIVTNLGTQPINHTICGGICTDWAEIGTAAGLQVIAYLDAFHPNAGAGEIKAAFSMNSTLSRDVIQAEATRAVVEQDERIRVVFEKDLVQEIETGFTFAEEAMTYDSEITLFITNIDAAAIGVNQYIASLPDVDFSEYAIFCTSGGETWESLLAQGETNESAIRGSIYYGGADPAEFLFETAYKMLMGEADIPYWYSESVWSVNNFGWTYERK